MVTFSYNEITIQTVEVRYDYFFIRPAPSAITTVMNLHEWQEHFVHGHPIRPVRIMSDLPTLGNFLSTTMGAPLADSHFLAWGERSAPAAMLVRGEAIDDWWEAQPE